MKKAYLAVILALMYIPIALVVLYSFNASRLNSVWSGFDLAWYRELFRDRAMFATLRNSLVLAAVSSFSAAVMYTSQVTMAMMASPDLKMVFPREGIGFGIMAGFIPSKAPNPEAAHAFLDYILDAGRGAGCFEFLGYYSTYSASDPYISEEVKEFLTLPTGFNINMEMIQNVSAEEEHSLVWTSFKVAAGK